MKHQHYWLDTGIPRWDVFLSGKFRYDCSVCDKQVFRREQPLNPLVPSAWDVYGMEVARGNAHLAIQPPMILSEESSWVEGERYKNLVTNERSVM